MGKKITIIEMLDALNNGGNHLHAKALAVQIEKYGININLKTKALEIIDNGVVCLQDDRQRLFEAETVIYAVGQNPLQTDAMAFHDCAPEFYTLGDCVMPKNITNATSAAYEISRTIGRYDFS